MLRSILKDCVLVFIRSRSWYLVIFILRSTLLTEVMSLLLYGQSRLVLILSWTGDTLRLLPELPPHADSQIHYLNEGDFSFP